MGLRPGLSAVLAMLSFAPLAPSGHALSGASMPGSNALLDEAWAGESFGPEAYLLLGRLALLEEDGLLGPSNLFLLRRRTGARTCQDLGPYVLRPAPPGRAVSRAGAGPPGDFGADRCLRWPPAFARAMAGGRPRFRMVGGGLHHGPAHFLPVGRATPWRHRLGDKPPGPPPANGKNGSGVEPDRGRCAPLFNPGAGRSRGAGSMDPRPFRRTRGGLV